MEKVLYGELNPTEFRDRIEDAPIAYLSLGTLKWNGEHLPLGSDSIQSQAFFEQSAREVGGKAPRFHASKELGDKIFALQLGRM